jgi:hypothetical protein
VQTRGQIDVEQGVELAYSFEQSDTTAVVERARDGDRPRGVRCRVDIAHGGGETTDEFLRRCAGLDPASTSTARNQPTGAPVDQG